MNCHHDIHDGRHAEDVPAYTFSEAATLTGVPILSGLRLRAYKTETSRDGMTTP